MEHRGEAMSELLLSRLPRPANLEAYRDEVKSLLEKNEKKLRGNKWTVRRFWIFVVAISIPFLVMAGENFNTSAGNWFLGWVCVWVLLAAIELAKYEHNRGRVELLKEVKQLQLQVLEVQAAASKSK